MAAGEIAWRAYVIPAIGKPLSKGDLGWVVSEAMAFLRTHPGYTIAIRSVDTGKVESTHSIHIRHGTGGMRVIAVPHPLRPRDERRLSADLAEVCTVLTNLGHPIPDPEEF